ncbi:MAG: hypothetical protein ACNYPI_02230 [Arenicellales bacterium WSBS_2016_MAG_OTU3]
MPIVVFSERIRAAVEKIEIPGTGGGRTEASDESLVKTISEIMQNPNLPRISVPSIFTEHAYPDKIHRLYCLA